MTRDEFPIPFGECGAAREIAAHLFALLVPLFRGEFGNAIEEFGIANRDEGERNGRVFVGAGGGSYFETEPSAFVPG